MFDNLQEFLKQFAPPDKSGGEDFFNQKRKAWHQGQQGITEARCDFAPDRFRLNARGLFFISLWKRSIYGRTLTEIKADTAMIEKFVNAMAPFIRDLIGTNLNQGQWAIVTPPPRRHTERNFAQQVAIGIADILGIPARLNVAHARSRQRINAEYDLVELPTEPNLIIFDDIVTTGSTLQSMRRLLLPHKKNLFFITAINNKT